MRSSSFKSLGLLLMLLVAGCASRPAYYVATPPPPPEPVQVEPLISVAEHNGFVDGERMGVADRDMGRSYKPGRSELFEEAPGYSPRLGGPFHQYRYYYRDGFRRGYHGGYLHG
ncbi:hypothetical protein [Acidipila rosea]|uniref:Lipoprotein n=1 Tax=Acidipila rosea TaxID=768535 RepID=A0A4R1LB42_9BACT|nr:hypothetical protein [Acidipila rosea]TCK75394.1 hypothetical protein C7378_0377 [Acidipila rosea]